MAFGAQLAVPPPHDLRTARRRYVNFNAFLRESGARVVRVQVVNLSTDGCKFRSDEMLETATIVWLKIDGLAARQAKIVWRGDEGYGCEFLKPMQDEVVEELCAAQLHEVRAAGRARVAARG